MLGADFSSVARSRPRFLANMQDDSTKFKWRGAHLEGSNERLREIINIFVAARIIVRSSSVGPSSTSSVKVC